MSPDAKWALHTYSTFDMPPVTGLVSLPEHRAVRVLAENAALKAAVAPLVHTPVEFFRVNVGDGVTLDGWMIRPTIVVDAPPDSRAVREEIFGPLVTVHPFGTEDEAVALANATRFGLNAMVFTRDLSRAHRVSAALRAGTVWVNCFFIRDLRAPFGGVGDSGVGREGGSFSREFFTEPKAVVMQL